MVCRQAGSAPPRRLLEMQVSRPSPTESESAFLQVAQVFLCTSKSAKHSSGQSGGLISFPEL